MSNNKQHFSRAPLWLEFSGLPERLTAKAGPGAWSVFKKLVELDCAANPMGPGTVEVAVSALARVTGQAAAKLPALIEKIRKQGLIRCYVPEHPDEPGLFELITPLPTPLAVEDIRKQNPALFRHAGFFRYVDTVKDIDPADPVLQKVVDLYFQCLGLQINTLALDQLRLLRERFALGQIERVMQQARRHEIQSLGWVARELLRQDAKKDGETKSKKQTNKKSHSHPKAS